VRKQTVVMAAVISVVLPFVVAESASAAPDQSGSSTYVVEPGTGDVVVQGGYWGGTVIQSGGWDPI